MHADRLSALLDAGRALVTELDADAVLHRLLDVARELTGARYAAIGVLDEDRSSLERFVTAGIEPDAQQAIGDLPRGRGVLGVLIEQPAPLRLVDVDRHPLSYGFPPGHPPMQTFLGVPIMIRGEAWGNLYLTEKTTEFTDEDEEIVVVLAEWASVAIANARVHTAERQRRAAAEIANRALETTTEVARALGGVTDVDRVLTLIAKRSRALLGAASAYIAMVEDDAFVVVASAGETIEGLGQRVKIDQSLAGAALRTGKAHRYDDIGSTAYARQHTGARRALVTPMVFRGRTLGVLTVLDRLEEGNPPFTPDHQRLVEAFAASAATAVATAQSATDEALRRSTAASEAERGRWARELHDETLQDLAALRLALSAARRSDDPQRWRSAIDDAVELIGGGIQNLRSLIADLRPAALDELGTGAALETLVERIQQRGGLAITLDVDLAFESGRADSRHSPDLEATVYRLVQEALTNIVKHADARTVRVTVSEAGEQLRLEVRDDGKGFDPQVRAAGFGLAGMHERAAGAGGQLEIESAPGEGTAVRATLPVRRVLAQAS